STLPYQQAARRRSYTLMNDADEKRGNGGDEETIEAVHQSPMAWDEMACILRAEVPLDRGLKQVAGLRQDRQNTRHYPNNPQLPDPARISDRDACGNPPGKTTDGAGPRLLRADARPQQRPADRPPAEEGEYIGRPDICE